MSELPKLKDWQGPLAQAIDRLRLKEDDLLAVIRLCQEALYDIELAYIYVRDQRSTITDWLNEVGRLYLIRFKKEVPILTKEQLQSEEILDSPQRRKTEVRKVALELGGPGMEVTDQLVLDTLMARGKRFIAHNPKATISTILVGFKSHFEKVEGKRGTFKRHAA